jgi:hypothetical protein
MAGSGQIRAGSAYVELFLKNNKLNHGLAESSKKLKAWGEGVSGAGGKLFAAGAAMRAPFLAAIKIAADMGSELVGMRAKTGISIEALSALGYAASVSGTDLEGLGNGLKKMQKKLGEAENGSDSAADSFNELGLSVAQLKGLSPDKQFELIAEKISAIEAPEKRVAAAMDIFGRAGADLLPIMGGLSEKIAEAKSAGLIINTEDAEAAKKFSHALETVWAQVKRVAFGIGSALIPDLGVLVEKIGKVLRSTIDWVSANRETIVWVAKIGTVVMAAGAALLVLGGVLTGLGAIAGAGVTAITALGTVLGVVGFVLGTLLTPVGLVGAGIGALAAYFITSTGVIGTATQWLAGLWQTLKGDALAAFQGIKDALSAGDFQLAAKILWATLRLEFQRGIGFLQQKWADFKAFFQRVWTEAVYGTARIFTQAWAGLQTAWSATVGFFGDTWRIFTGVLTRTWQTASGLIKKSWEKMKGLFGVSTEAEVDLAIKGINEETAAENKASQEAQDKAIADAEAARKEKQKGINSEEAGALSELEKQRKRDMAGIDKGQNSATAGLEKEIEDLKAKRDALLKQAKGEAATAAAEDLGKKEAELKDRLDGAGDEVEKKSKVQGSFSANAAARFGGGGGDMAKIAKHTADTAKHTKETRDEVRKQKGLVANNN